MARYVRQKPNLAFLKKKFSFLGFQVLIYEDRTQNYDPEIHEEYLTHAIPFLLQTHHL